MFGLGPAYLFILQYRLPLDLMRSGWWPWAVSMATNLAIATVVTLLIWLIGLKAFLLVHLPSLLLAASVGVWMFYVQQKAFGACVSCCGTKRRTVWYCSGRPAW